MVLTAHSAMEIVKEYHGDSTPFSCVSNLHAGTVWYQFETEEATGYTEMHVPQSLTVELRVVDAFISATPIIMVWEASDLVSPTAPSTVYGPRPPLFTTDTSLSDSDSSLSNGTVAAISVSAVLTVILLVSGFLFYRSWRRRRSIGTSQHEVNTGTTPGDLRPDDAPKAEMEDPVSAQELCKQSGAFRGKPELGNEAATTRSSNPEEGDRTIPPTSQDDIAEDSATRDRACIVSGRASPAELE